VKADAARAALAAVEATAVLSRLGQGAPARDDRQPARLVRLAPAQLGRADAVLPAQGNRRAASAHAGTAGSRWRSGRAGSGIEAWFKLDAAELLGDDAAQYEKMRDTLDVWFDSGTTHRTVLRGSHAGEATWPADLYLEGSDQHRGWFHSSLLTGCMRSTAVRPTRRC
jgi:hypothetical protein